MGEIWGHGKVKSSSSSDVLCAVPAGSDGLIQAGFGVCSDVTHAAPSALDAGGCAEINSSAAVSLPSLQAKAWFICRVCSCTFPIKLVVALLGREQGRGCSYGPGGRGEHGIRQGGAASCTLQCLPSRTNLVSHSAGGLISRCCVYVRIVTDPWNSSGRKECQWLVETPGSIPGSACSTAKCRAQLSITSAWRC